MQAFGEGKRIQFITLDEFDESVPQNELPWKGCTRPTWNEEARYRIQPGQ
jgi:hypothetical protein